MNKIIEIVISPKGETTIQTKGFAGSSCREASRFLEQALGAVTTDVNSAEFYQNAQSQQQEVKQ